MKKSKVTAIIAMCLIFAALCSCGKATPPIQTATDVTSAIVTEAASIVPQTDENGETLPYFALSALPKLEPYSPPKEIFTRFYEEFTDHLIPSDEYGELIPFKGKKLSYYLPESMYGGIYDGEGDDNLIFYPEEASLYGLATLDGKIVVDPVYNYVRRESLDNGKHIYVLTKNNKEQADYDGISSIIASDGSWMIDNGYNRAPYEFTENRIILGKTESDGVEVIGNSNDYYVYDYNGKYLYTIEDVSYVSPYSDGYACATIYKDEGTYSQFYDINGNKAFKEINAYAYDFKNGYARVSDYETNTNYYIDTNGKIHTIVPDNALGFYEENDLWRFRCKENKLRAESVYNDEDETVFYATDDSGMSYIFNLDGETLYKTYGIENINWVMEDYFVIIVNDEDGVARQKIVERTTGEIIYAADAEYNDYGYILSSIYSYYGVDDLFVVGEYNNDFDEYHHIIFDAKKRKIIDEELSDNDTDITRVNGVLYYSRYEGDYSVLHDENDNVILRINTNSTD